MPFWMGAQNLRITHTDTGLQVAQDARVTLYAGPLVSLAFALVIGLTNTSEPRFGLELTALAFIAFPTVIFIPLGLYFHRQPPVITWSRITRQLTLPRQALTIDSAHATLVLRIEHHDDSEGGGTYPVLVWLLRPTPDDIEIVLYISQWQKHLRASATQFSKETAIPLIDHTR
jgi:hypothetical protein